MSAAFIAAFSLSNRSTPVEALRTKVLAAKQLADCTGYSATVAEVNDLQEYGEMAMAQVKREIESAGFIVVETRNRWTIRIPYSTASFPGSTMYGYGTRAFNDARLAHLYQTDPMAASQMASNMGLGYPARRQ